MSHHHPPAHSPDRDRVGSNASAGGEGVGGDGAASGDKKKWNRSHGQRGSGKAIKFNANYLLNFQYEDVEGRAKKSQRGPPGGGGDRSPYHSGTRTDSATAKKAYVLQNFQFVLSESILTDLGAATKCVNALFNFDELPPWELVSCLVCRDTLDDHNCPICLDTPQAPRVTSCGHIFCYPCLLRHLDYLKVRGQPRACPVCNAIVVKPLLRPVLWNPCTEHFPGKRVNWTLLSRPKELCQLWVQEELAQQQQLQQKSPAPTAKNEDSGLESTVHSLGASQQDPIFQFLQAVLPIHGSASSAFARFTLECEGLAESLRQSDTADLNERLQNLKTQEAMISAMAPPPAKEAPASSGHHSTVVGGELERHPSGVQGAKTGRTYAEASGVGLAPSAAVSPPRSAAGEVPNVPSELDHRACLSIERQFCDECMLWVNGLHPHQRKVGPRLGGGSPAPPGSPLPASSASPPTATATSSPGSTGLPPFATSNSTSAYLPQGINLTLNPQIRSSILAFMAQREAQGRTLSGGNGVDSVASVSNSHLSKSPIGGPTPAARSSSSNSGSSPAVKAERDPTTPGSPPGTGAGHTSASSNPNVLVYRATDGQQVYLHFLNWRMIRDAFLTPSATGSGPGSESNLPFSFDAPIEDVETVTQTQSTRSSYKAIAHIPLHSTFKMCFVDLSKVVPPAIMKQYAPQIEQRRRRIRAVQERDEELAAQCLAQAWNVHKEIMSGGTGNAFRTPDISPEMLAQMPSIEEALPELSLGPSVMDGGPPYPPEDEGEEEEADEDDEMDDADGDQNPFNVLRNAKRSPGLRSTGHSHGAMVRTAWGTAPPPASTKRPSPQPKGKEGAKAKQRASDQDKAIAALFDRVKSSNVDDEEGEDEGTGLRGGVDGGTTREDVGEGGRKGATSTSSSGGGGSGGGKKGKSKPITVSLTSGGRQK